MEIIITDNDRIKVYDDHFALMKKHKRSKKGENIWEEYRWFTSLGDCISFLTRSRLSLNKTALKPAEFLKEYNRLKNEIETIVKH